MAVLQTYQCPCCGGAISFDSKIQKMKCPYCDTEFELETLKAYEDDVQTSTETGEPLEWESSAEQWKPGETSGMRVYTCRNCAGEIVADETTGATTCPYCGSPVVMSGQFSGDLKPDLVIPFQLDKKAAKQKFSEHLKGKRMLPKVFRTEAHIDEIKGVYVPFWLYDADVHASVRYRTTRHRVWSDRNYNYRETSFFSVLREGNLSFEGVPVDGSSKLPNDLTESIEPFDLHAAAAFHPDYLAGYLAERYDVGADESKTRAAERINRSTSDAFSATVQGYVTKETVGQNISLSRGKARYALLPIWLMTTSWNGQQYLFAMNGQTGKFVGDLPTDRAIFLRTLFGLTGILTAAFFALSYLIWLL